jgi:hypothetical protein
MYWFCCACFFIPFCAAAMLFEALWQEDNNAYVTTSNPDFNFVAVGDWGCTPNTIITVKHIVTRNPEIIISLGDLSYQDTADCWLKIIEPINERMKITIGNHDDSSSSKLSQYMTHFGLTKQYYSFNYQNVHFVAMSNEVLWKSGSDQYNFVNNDLSRAAGDPKIDWIVVFSHKPMYKSPNFVSSQIVFRDTYHPLFDKYGVDVVLQAHDHNYQRTYPLKYNPTNSSNPIITSAEMRNYNMKTAVGGQIYAIVGTGGVNLHGNIYQQENFIAVQQGVAYGILNFDLINNGRTLVGTFYANDGYLDDLFIIDKAPTINDSITNKTYSSFNQSETTANKLLTYENPDLGIKIEHPVGWQQIEPGRGVSPLYPVFSPPSENGSIWSRLERLQIFVYDSQNRSLGELVTKEIADFKRKIISDFDIIDGRNNNTFLANLPAYSLVYTGKEGEHEFKAREFWTTKGDKVYNILYIASPSQYGRNLQTTQRMIDSFEVTK